MLSDWEKTAELADWDTLVLGNVASIAVDAHFDYRSLYKIALNREMRDLKIDRLLKALRTKALNSYWIFCGELTASMKSLTQSTTKLKSHTRPFAAH